MDTRALASAERADLAAFCRTLSAAEWEKPSLCEGWRVRDVIAHLVQVDEGSVFRHALGFVRAGLSIDRFNAIGIRRYASWTTERLVETLEAQIDLGWLSRTRRGLPALAETVIHHQDIRRALGSPRSIPPERLLATLGAPETFTGASRRAGGLHLVATDLDWTRGEGAEVKGPAEAIIMALAGRKVALTGLRGPGVEIIAGRIGAERS